MCGVLDKAEAGNDLLDYLSIHYLYSLSVKVTEKLEPVPAACRHEAGYTLSRSLIYCRHEQTFTLTITPTGSLQQSANTVELIYMSLECGKKPGTPRGNPSRHRDRKGPVSGQVLPTAPLCHGLYFILKRNNYNLTNHRHRMNFYNILNKREG